MDSKINSRRKGQIIMTENEQDEMIAKLFKSLTKFIDTLTKLIEIEIENKE